MCIMLLEIDTRKLCFDGIKLNERKSQHSSEMSKSCDTLRLLMPGLLTLRNCFRSQGNVAM